MPVESAPHRLQLVPRAALAGLAAWLAGGRFQMVSDDAWISWRYSWNLVHGYGLRYNPHAEPVEGYSNLLWTLWSAVGIRLHIPVASWCFGSGLALAALTTWLTAAIAWRLSGSRMAERSAGLLAATSYAIGSCATTGLETPLLVALVTGSVYLCSLPSVGALWAGALCAGFAATTHVQGPIFLLAPLVAALLRGGISRRQWAVLGVLALGPFAAQEVFRLAYYHSPLPLTFLVKMSGSRGTRLVNGIRLLGAAITLNLGWVALAALGTWVGRRKAAVPVAVIIADVAFILIVNGDDIGGLRFIASAMPALAVLAGLGLAAITRRGVPGWLVAGAAVLATGAWELTIQHVRVARVEESGSQNAEDTLGAALTPPWVLHESQSVLAPFTGAWTTPAEPQQAEWFITWLVENVPLDGSFTFADVGLVGYTFNGTDLWDMRGLNWPATARMNAVSLAQHGGSQSSPEAGALVEDFAARSPDVALFLCQGGRPIGRSEDVLGASPVFVGRYRFVGSGTYFPASRESICVYQRLDASVPTEVAVKMRRDQIARDMPGIYAGTGP